MKKLLPFLLALSLFTGAGAQLQPNTWPKSRSDLANTGRSIFSGAQDILKWKFQDGVANSFYQSPAVDINNIVYEVGTDGNTYAIYGNSGKIKWTSPTGSSIYSSPTIDQYGTIYVGNDLGYLYALNGNTGAVLWKVGLDSKDVGQLQVGSPTIGPTGVIYVLCHNAYLYAVDLKTGSLIWSFDLGGYALDAATVNTPAIGPDGTIYITGGSQIVALQPNGGTIWTYSDSVKDEYTSPALSSKGFIYYGSTSGYIYCLNASNGGLQWSYAASSQNFRAAPAIGPSGTVYAGAMDGYLYALDPISGSLKWSYNGLAPIIANPVIAGDGTVYFQSDDGNMYVLNGISGELEWLFGADQACYDAAIGPDGCLYLPSADGTIYAFATGVIPLYLQLQPSTVVGGYSSVGTVTLSGPAPAGGLKMALASDTGGVVVPYFVTVPAGQAFANFSITTPIVVSQFEANITASANGFVLGAVLTLSPFAVANLVVNPSSLVGGLSSTGTVTLNGAAPSTGLDISLSSNQTSITVPGLVNVAPGQTTATFQIKTLSVTAPIYAVITAELNGTSPQLAYLTVNPSVLSSLILAPSTVGGGSSSTGTVNLTGPAPTGGFKVQLSNSNSSAGLPSSVSIPAGQSSATFSIHTTEVTKETVAVIVATLGSITRAASLTIVPPQIESISLSPTTVAGGTSVKGTVYLTGDANKSGLSVKLKSSVKGVTVPAAVAVGSGKSSATFTVTTIAVSSLTKATITGTTGTVSATATLTVNQPTLVSLTVSPTSVKGGKTSTGTVKISSVAPTGGMVIELTSAANGVTVPAKVTVPAGRTSVTFTVKTVKGMPTGAVSISASQGGTSKSATITLT